MLYANIFFFLSIKQFHVQSGTKFIVSILWNKLNIATVHLKQDPVRLNNGQEMSIFFLLNWTAASVEKHCWSSFLHAYLSFQNVHDKHNLICSSHILPHNSQSRVKELFLHLQNIYSHSH